MPQTHRRRRGTAGQFSFRRNLSIPILLPASARTGPPWSGHPSGLGLFLPLLVSNPDFCSTSLFRSQPNPNLTLHLRIRALFTTIPAIPSIHGSTRFVFSIAEAQPELTPEENRCPRCSRRIIFQEIWGSSRTLCPALSLPLACPLTTTGRSPVLDPAMGRVQSPRHMG